jgi:phosphinothricin acetyltransferase
MAAVTAIYRQHVLQGTASFETEPPSEGEMQQRRLDVLAKAFPYLVVLDRSQVVGFAYCSGFRPRPAYCFSAEDSIYLAPQAQGQGLGRALLAELLAQAERVGVRRLIAMIGDSANHGSIALHRALGFEPVGVLPSCGWKFNRWLDVVLMEKALGWGDKAPPAAPNAGR